MMTRTLHAPLALAVIACVALAFPALAQDGAIFSPTAGYAPLHQGTRAARVGDTLTILLIETTTTSKSVTGKSDRSGGLSITPPASGPFAFLSPEALKAGSSASFKGQGNAAQTSALAASLAVTITEVRPNGTAVVKGEKQMTLSQGDEWVRFSGIIRLADIDVENTLPSSRVAEARIEYSGKGAIQRSARPGWLSRFFSRINPF